MAKYKIEDDEIKQHLVDTRNIDLAEAVIGENYWGSCFPQTTANTDSENDPERTCLGRYR